MNDEMTELSVATPRHSVLFVKLMLATLFIAIIAMWDGDSALHWLFVVSITSMLIYVLVVPDETYRVWVDDKRVRLVKVTTRQEHFVLPEDIVSIKIHHHLLLGPRWGRIVFKADNESELIAHFTFKSNAAYNPAYVKLIKIAKRLDHKLESECRPASPS